MKNMFQVLKHRAYRHLFAAQAFSLIGTGLTTVALGLLAYNLAGADAGLVLGTAFTLKMIAYVGISPIAGAFATRMPRRTFLVTLDFIRAGLVLLLPFVSEIWHIYVLVFAFQSFSAAFTPTFQATIPDVLPEEHDYTNALSLSRLAYDLESLLSPLLAGVLLTFISFHWLFAGTMLGFLASAALVLSVTLPSTKTIVQEAGIYRRITRGIRIYLATPRLRGLLALYLAVSAAGAMVIVNSVVYIRDMLGGSDRDVAILFMAYGLGSMIVACILPRILDRVAQRTVMLAGAVLLAIVLFCASSGAGFGMALIFWALLGAGSSLVQTPAGLVLRRSSHAEDRPTLFSAQFALSHTCWLIAYPAAGWMGAHFGLDMAFLVMACGALAGTMMAMLLWPADDPEVLFHEHAETVHDHLHSRDEHHQHHHVNSGCEEPHSHLHKHVAVRHSHEFIIDDHHPSWPER